MPNFYITLKAIIEPIPLEGIAGRVIEGNHVMRTLKREPDLSDFDEAKFDYYNEVLKPRRIKMDHKDLVVTMCVPMFD